MALQNHSGPCQHVNDELIEGGHVASAKLCLLYRVELFHGMKRDDCYLSLNMNSLECTLFCLDISVSVSSCPCKVETPTLIIITCDQHPTFSSNSHYLLQQFINSIKSILSVCLSVTVKSLIL